MGWGDKIPASTLVIFALGDLEPVAWLTLCLSFSFPSLSLWLVLKMMMFLMELVTVEMRDCPLWWPPGLMVVSSMAGVCL